MTDLHTHNVPLLIDPRSSPRLSALGADIRAALAEQSPGLPAGAGYDLADGIAVVEVSGVLVPRLGIRRSLGIATGYDGIRANMLDAMADDQARAIVLLVDSPGGYCAGLPDLADAIYAMRGAKPIVAVLDEMACSAAYWLASAADVVTVPRSGTIGSVGVIVQMMDVSRSLANAGVDVHFVHFGSEKAVEARAVLTGMTPAALASVQAEVDEMGEMFVAAVARNRDLPADAIRSLEAACFTGNRGVVAGLADSVLSPDQAFAALLADLAAA